MDTVNHALTVATYILLAGIFVTYSFRMLRDAIQLRRQKLDFIVYIDENEKIVADYVYNGAKTLTLTGIICMSILALTDNTHPVWMELVILFIFSYITLAATLFAWVFHQYAYFQEKV